VVLDTKLNYVKKMTDILSDKTKFKFKGGAKEKDNLEYFIKQEEKFNSSLYYLKRNERITNEFYTAVRSTGAQPSKLYGLAKIHKDQKDPPYRPILSMVNSFKSNLAKKLDEILKPFIPSSYISTDTFNFIEKLSAVKIKNKNPHYMSIDAKSLFTNIPIERTIKHICSILPFHSLPFTEKTFIKLLRMACTNVPFIFNDNIYEQFDGMAMGSNLAPTFANFAMDMIESQFHKLSSEQKPLFYTRYVDDIFVLFNNESSALKFYDFMNSIDKNLQFTYEMPHMHFHKQQFLYN